ncbi:hypothetical protein OIV83_003671 [Microbotryomycetes sp. JL201]|nr:hypothetical protein OIV83_003671 [Microbotryomycetes sp. JL201]
MGINMNALELNHMPAVTGLSNFSTLSSSAAPSTSPTGISGSTHHEEAGALPPPKPFPTASKASKSGDRKAKHRARPGSKVPLICEICHRQFTTNSNLRRHSKLYRDKLTSLVAQLGDKRGTVAAHNEHVNSNPHGPKTKMQTASKRRVGKDVQQRHQELAGAEREEPEQGEESGSDHSADDTEPKAGRVVPADGRPNLSSGSSQFQASGMTGSTSVSEPSSAEGVDEIDDDDAWP